MAAAQSSTLGKPGSVPRNECVTMLGYPRLPCDCGYPYIYGGFANGTKLFLNATASITGDGHSLELTAAAPEGFQATASRAVAIILQYFPLLTAHSSLLTSHRLLPTLPANH